MIARVAAMIHARVGARVVEEQHARIELVVARPTPCDRVDLRVVDADQVCLDQVIVDRREGGAVG
jgi:hypothetical protein